MFLANYSIQHWGDPTFPGGPHTVTILGLTAPSGVLFVGLSFSLRDGAQLALGRWAILGAIVLGAALSYLVAPSLAVASGVAFLFGETLDWALYTPLVERGRVVTAVTLSNTVGAAIDTVVFLWIAFDTLNGAWDLYWLKLLMTLPTLAVVVPLRRRVVSRYQPT